jgi:hypothetical protein
LVAALALAPCVSAQTPAAADTAVPITAEPDGPPPLEFLGFRAGASLAEVSDLVQQLGGKRLHCDRSKRDPNVSECRADLWDPKAGTPVSLWLSAVDSMTMVLTVSGPVNAEQLTEWKDTLENRFGLVGARVQGTQWMMQWVRQGRMLRLTWRIEKTQKLASVSLVDGRLLDDWGKTRETGGK